MISRSFLAVLVPCLTIAGVPSPGGPDPAEGPRPVPDPDALKRTEKSIKEIYKREYEWNSRQARKVFARKLLERAGEDQGDLAACFVLCREARDVSSEAGDASGVLSSVISMGKLFEIDPVEMAGDALKRVAKSAREPEEHKELVRARMLLSSEARKRDQYSAARKMLSSARSSLAKARDPTLAAEVRQAGKDLQVIAKEYRKVEKVLRALESGPGDPGSYTSAGRFLCFIKGDWKKGLPMLAKGTEPSTVDLARLELEVGQDPAARLAVADGWRDLSGKLKGLQKRNLLLHASWWFAGCFAQLKGLEKERVSRYLEEIVVDNPPTPTQSFERGRKPEGLVLVKFDGKSLSGWEPAEGKWRVAGKEIASAGRDNRYLRSLPAATWQQIHFEFRGGNPGLYFGRTEKEVRAPGVNLDSSARNNGEIRRAVATHQWHALLVQQGEGQLQFTLDGELVYSGSFPEPGFILVKAQRGELRVRKLLALGTNPE